MIENIVKVLALMLKSLNLESVVVIVSLLFKSSGGQMDLNVIIPAASQCQFPELNLIITFPPACPPALNNLLS